MRNQLKLISYLFLCTVIPVQSLLAKGDDSTSRSIGKSKSGIKKPFSNENIYSSYLNALMLERYGRLEEALEKYSEILEQEPDATLVFQQRANLHLRLGNPEKALQDIQKYVQSHPEDTESLLLLSNIYLIQGQKTAARLVLEKVLKANPKDTETLLNLGILLITAEPQESIKHFERLLELDPLSAKAYYHLGLLYHSMGQLQKSKDMFQKVMEIDSESLPSSFFLGQMSEKEGDIPSALKYYQNALDKMPENFPLRMQLILLHAQETNIDKVEELLEEYKDNPNSPVEANLWLGIVHESKKEWHKALEYYLRAKKQTDSVELYIRLAGVYSHLGKAKKALDLLNGIIEKFPDNAQFRYFLGLAYLDLKKPDRAVKELKKAVKLNKEFSEAFFQMGVAYDLLGKWDKAEEMFRETIRIDSNNASAYNYIGYTYADRNEDLPMARKFIEKALEIDPNNPAFVDSLGWLNFREGRYQAALRFLKEAAENIDDPIIDVHLGDTYLALEQKNEAAFYYSKSLDKDPKNQDVIKKLNKLNKSMVTTSPARQSLKKFQFGLKQASNISGVVQLKTNFAFLTRNLTKGFFYLRRDETKIYPSTQTLQTDVRVDLLDRTLLSSIVLRYSNNPNSQWSVFPPEFKNQMPLNTNDIIGTVASFLSGQLLQEFDQLSTNVKEKSKSYLLTQGKRSLQIDKEKGFVTEYESEIFKLRVDDYHRVEGAWLPKVLSFNFKNKSQDRKEPKTISIEFSGLTLKKIENRIFEIGQQK